MKNPTYQEYLDNPAIREHFHREARRARSETVHRFLFAPLMRMFTRSQPKPAPVLQMSA
jgi:hypothetical protein